ncbi:MAG: flagellar assembly protein FliW [Candidatus Solibacter sp.]
MPKCQTKYHGETAYDEQATLHFPRGLFGFETETRFLPIERPALQPLIFLQSLSTPDLCFISVPVFLVDRGYALSLRPEDLASVGLPADQQPSIAKDVLCLAIVRIQQGSPTTANLLAPVVVNLRNSKAVQAVSQDQNHSHQALLPAPSEEFVCS